MNQLETLILALRPLNDYYLEQLYQAGVTPDVLTKAERDGYIEIEDKEGDRPLPMVRLTEKGMVRREKIQAARIQNRRLFCPRCKGSLRQSGSAFICVTCFTKFSSEEQVIEETKLQIKELLSNLEKDGARL